MLVGNDGRGLVSSEKTILLSWNKFVAHDCRGYSKVFWAAAKNVYDSFNLLDFKIPDGYKITGWDESNKLILEKCEPYHYKDEEVDIIIGSFFKEIELIVN